MKQIHPPAFRRSRCRRQKCINTYGNEGRIFGTSAKGLAGYSKFGQITIGVSLEAIHYIRREENAYGFEPNFVWQKLD